MTQTARFRGSSEGSATLGRAELSSMIPGYGYSACLSLRRKVRLECDTSYQIVTTCSENE